MGKRHSPRFGSMQVWPRKRAKRPVARVRSWPKVKDAKPLGFPCYKAGMTHVMLTESRKTSHMKGERVRVPVTVLECPPVRMFGVRAYKHSGYGLAVSGEVWVKADKALARRLDVGKVGDFSAIEALRTPECVGLALLVHTQPRLTGIGKKTPEVLELRLGGSLDEQLAFIKDHLDRPITVQEVFAEGDLADAHGVTRGKGYQGPVKRFGIGLRSHKSEKGRRGPGSIGTWIAQAHTSYRIAHAGQMGYHLRTQYNNQIMKIGEKPIEINPEGGFVGFGLVRGTYLLMRGSIQGPKKRIITLTKPVRALVKPQHQAPEYIYKESQQGV
ncbi:MAG: 50S ribosomal protein L3 [Nitrosarchaeum sp.]|nr:50S ribosomal protein L3 [Nitrosarchaeum sp.]